MKELTLNQIALWCGAPTAQEYNSVRVTGVCSDSREVRAGDLFIALPVERTDGHAYVSKAAEAGAAAALVTHKVDAPILQLCVADTLRAYGALAANYRKLLHTRVIGITGSVGKTTTKEMMACALQGTFRTAKSEGNHNNDLGLPMSIMALEEDVEVAVLEMGMNHFGEMAYLTSVAQPDIAVITNIGTMHIEHLGSREGILRAKLEILQGVPRGGVGVFNGDEPLLWNVRSDGGLKKFYYGIENTACDVIAEDIEELEDGMRFRVRGMRKSFEVYIPAAGRHMVYNALAVITTALLLEVKPEALQRQLGQFHNTGMRQKIYEYNGVTIIEDCYNAGPESMQAALNVLENYRAKGRRIAVLGDMLELGNRSSAEHYRIGRLVAQKADMLFVYGEHSVRTVTGAITGGMNPKNTEHFDTHEDLARMLKMRVSEGDVVLIKGSRGMKMERVLELFLKDEKK